MHIVADLDSALAARRRSLRQAQGRRRLMLLLIAAGVVGCLAGYKLLAMSSAFSVTGIDVHGASPALGREVEGELQRAAMGRSLLETDAGSLAARLEQLPYVRAAHVDRAFPHTLSVTIEPYRPAVYVVSGETGWLVASDGRVLGEASHRPPGVALITIPAGAALTAGDRTGDTNVSSGLALLRAAPAGFRRTAGTVTRLISRAGTITAVVGTHIQLRFGEPTDLELKMQVGERVLQRFGAQQRRNLAYIDLSAPGRPALGMRNASTSTLG